ncbi:FRG domain-containing protein [Agromyces mariniharenae]|uniref:FRG domain-containing protein n=1 Tax=Agromyces mariniharenae TaxID=2604423 RepID=A0A5S4V4U1_9MICO|nr:FRG domain-containing protein [Agromyces mariniharenae]TYL54026.1 FRG domain-containing protein [Agromyces mariniharenae]
MVTAQRWIETGWYVVPRNPRDLFATLGAIGGYSSRARFAWRGHSSADFDLISSLQRAPNLEDEASLRRAEQRTLREARDWGLGYGFGGWASDLQLLADLQHYGTSTRLIDFTSNPMTALWFACLQPPRDTNVSRSGLLLAMNTAEWPRFGRARPSDRRSSLDNSVSAELEEALAGESPFVVESLSPNDRLRAQEGFFIADRVPDRVEQSGPFKSVRVEYERVESDWLKTMLSHPGDRHRLGTAGPVIPFVAVKVRQEIKHRVRLMLENTYNRTPRTLFPDFTGFREMGHTVTPREKSPTVNEHR